MVRNGRFLKTPKHCLRIKCEYCRAYNITIRKNLKRGVPKRFLFKHLGQYITFAYVSGNTGYKILLCKLSVNRGRKTADENFTNLALFIYSISTLARRL